MKKLFITSLLIALFGIFSYGQMSVNLFFQGSPCDSIVWVNGFITGGSPPYSATFDWGDGSISGNLVVQSSSFFETHAYLTSGFYLISVMVTDSQGDTASALLNAVVQISSGISATANVQNHFCNPCGGSISLNVSGGQPPYFISWSNGATGLTAANLCSGSYTAYISDSSGCSYFDTFSVSNSQSLTYVVTDPSCNASDGSIAVVTDTLANQFSYSWSTGSTDSVITNLGSGGYALIVNGPCSYIDSFFLYDSCGTVSGYVFSDLNGNGVQDPGESALAGSKVTLQPDNIITYTNANGFYSINTPDYDTYVVQVTSPNFYVNSCIDSFGGFVSLPGSFTVPSTGTYTVNVSISNPTSSGNDFGISPPDDNCGTISGIVFEDQNNNGVQDPGELGYAGAAINTNIGAWAITDMMGSYSISVPLNVPVTVSLSPGYNGYYCNSYSLSYVQTFPASNGNYNVTVTSADPDTSEIDFGIDLSNPTYDVGVYTIWTTQNITAGDMLNMWMDFKASGTITTDCILRLEYNPILSFISSSVTPSATGSGFIEWTYTAGTAPSWYCMNIVFDLDSSAVAGQNLQFTGTYGCGGNDACAYNDTLIRDFDVDFGPLKTSSAPVEMYSFLPKGAMPYQITQSDSVFSFVISYQNTSGYDASRLVIENPISEFLDISTISFPFSPHHYEMTISEDNTVLFEFDAVDIPDSSTNEFMSYGFIQYNIEAKPNLPLGTVITNKALVSWNGYDPEWTNEVQHKVDAASGIGSFDSESFTIFPNPTDGWAWIDVASNDIEVKEVNVYSVVGNLVSQSYETVGGYLKINTSGFVTGMYIVQIETGSSTLSSKLLVK